MRAQPPRSAAPRKRRPPPPPRLRPRRETEPGTGPPGPAGRPFPLPGFDCQWRRYGATMAKQASGYRCTECGWQSLKWTGRCGECQAWGTVEEAAPSRLVGQASGPRPMAAGAGRRGQRREARWRSGQHASGADRKVDAAAASARRPGWTSWTGAWRRAGARGRPATGGELELASPPCCSKPGARGGFGPGAVRDGEESAAQVRLRADRVGAISENLYLAAETDLDAIISHIAAVDPRLLIIDSVQTISAAGWTGDWRGDTGPRGRGGAYRRGQGAGTADDPGRPCHQGRLGGRAAHARASRRRVLQFEGDRHSGCGWCAR